MANRLIGIWILFVTLMFIAGFFSREAASFEPFTRYIYVVVISVCLITAALGLMRRQHSEGK